MRCQIISGLIVLAGMVLSQYVFPESPLSAYAIGVVAGALAFGVMIGDIVRTRQELSRVKGNK